MKLRIVASRLVGIAAVALVGVISTVGPAAASWAPDTPLGKHRVQIQHQVERQHQPPVQHLVQRASGPLGQPVGFRKQQAPQGLYAADLAVSLKSVTPSVVTRSAANTLTVSGTISNTADVPLSDLIVRYQRGAPLVGERAVAAEVAQPSQPTSVIAGDWQSFGDVLAVGGSRAFQLSTTISGDVANSLQITQPGIYPVMANINGTRPIDGLASSVRLGEVHLILTVTSIPGSAATARTAATTGSKTTGAKTTGARAPVPMAMTWPITSIPHRTVDGVFTSEALAQEISAGGTLASNLDALQRSGLPAKNTVIVIDPMLLDELDIMTQGYRVVAPGQTPAPLDPATGTSIETRPVGTNSTLASSRTSSSPPASSARRSASAGAGSLLNSPQHQPTGAARTSAPASSTGSGTVVGSLADTVAGTHGDAASAFLERLRGLSESSTVIVLPYSNPDTVRLTQAHQGGWVRTLRTEGISVAGRVLGRTDLVVDVGVPTGAVIDADTVDTYQRIGFRSLLLSRTSVSGAAIHGVGRVAGSSTTLPALVGDDVLQPLLAQTIDPATGTSGATALNASIALIAARHGDGSDQPVLQLPGSIVDLGGLTALGGAITQLAGDGIVTGVNVRGATSDAPKIADLQVTLPSDAPLLPEGYFDQLMGVTEGIAQTARVIDPAHGIGEGSRVISTLRTTLMPLASSSLQRSQTQGRAILSTLDASLLRISNAVAIRTTSGSYTLASADSPLVLTVQNKLPFPVTVRLAVTGGVTSGLTLTLPPSIDLDGKRSKQISIPSSVARAGTFTITIRLATPGKGSQPWGAQERVEIRSNAYGALTLILVIVAGGVLFLMVGLRVLQRFREHGKQPPPPPPTDSIAAMAQEAHARPVGGGGSR